MEQIIKISEFILHSFIDIWPYLLISIPIAVIVQMTGASKYLNKALNSRPIISILLATIVGAFSPFCSCGVIPIIASLLIGGVPIAPVMSFWIASPSMDPEIFFLSTATIGWKLSIWRLAATFCISLLSGYITHLLIIKGMIGGDILKTNMTTSKINPLKNISKKAWKKLKVVFIGESEQNKLEVQLIPIGNTKKINNIKCCAPASSLMFKPYDKAEAHPTSTCKSPTCSSKKISIWNKISRETIKATVMVAKFMSLAFFINALIQFYVPQESISNLLGGIGFQAIITASLIGIPFYTSNLTALPLISGLLDLGMNEGAALAFLISGPITTLPAMAAVWGIVKKKIFVLYISFSLTGALVFGILYNFMN